MLERVRGRLGLALAVALAVNVALFAGWLWSRGGQTTVVSIQLRGEQFEARVDGRVALAADVQLVHESGEIVVAIDDSSGTPSLPKPRGIDRIVVRDLATGEVLVDERFNHGRGEDARWTIVDGTAVVDGGLLRPDGALTLRLPDPGVRDHAIEVTFRNVASGRIGTRIADDPTLFYSFDVFRDPSQRLVVVEPGPRGREVEQGPIEPSVTEVVRSMLAMALRPYPYVAAATLIGIVAAVALHIATRARVVQRFDAPRLPASACWYAAGALTLATFAVALVLAHRYAGHEPTWPDSVAYVFQAKILASGRLAAQAPPLVESFAYFYPPLVVQDGDRYAGIFPFGHPLWLTPGALVGAPWLMPPLAGAACVALTFAAGRKLYDARTGILAAALLATSPFFLMQASNLMSHNTAAMYLLAAFVATLYGRHGPLLLGVIAGLCFGLFFNTRPLSAAAVVPFFALLLADVARPASMRERARFGAGLAASGLAMVGAYLLFNLGTTGELFGGNYSTSNDARLGFGGTHNVSYGVSHEQTEIAYLLLVLHGWPGYVGLALVLLPFTLGTRNRHDWGLLAATIAMMAAYTLFAENGVMQGPRMWYETVPFLMLLSARGAFCAGRLLSDVAARAWRGGRTWAGEAVVLTLVAALIGSSAYGWLLGRHPSWDVQYVPNEPSQMRGYNAIEQNLAALTERADIHNALVLVESKERWQCYGTVFWRNNPDLDGDVVYALFLEERNLELFAKYPDRHVYVADCPTQRLLAYGEDPGRTPGPLPSRPGPLAGDVLRLSGE